MQFYFIFLTALFIAMVTVPLLMKMAHRLHIVDIPDARKVHTGAIPRVGGIGMVLGTLLGIGLWMDLEPLTRSLMGGILTLSLFGILDDRYDLDYRLKFLGQGLAVGIVMFSGDLLIRQNGLNGGEPVALWLAYPLTFLFLLGTTNAMNLSDGLDGLAAGLSLLSLAAIAYLAQLADGQIVIGIALATIGSILGFLRYNTHPALVFMGDTGSQFLGFSTGILAILVTQEVNTAISGALPLLILGLPVVDTLLVMSQRILLGLSPFKPDRRHFHHRLLALGFDHYEAVLIIYAIQAIFILLACWLRYESDTLILTVYASLFAVVGLFYPLADTLKWRIRSLSRKDKTPLANWYGKLSESKWLKRGGYILASLIIISILISVAIDSPTINVESGGIALLILLIWLLLLLIKSPLKAHADRPAIYSGVLLIIYILGSNTGLDPTLITIINYLVVALALIIGLTVRLSRRYFNLTPSDFLVLFVLMAASTLPVFSRFNYALMAIESAVILYGIEYIFQQVKSRSILLRIGVMIALLVIGLKAAIFFQA